MAYRKNQTNAQIVALALRGIEGETTTGNMSVSNRAGLRYMGGTGRMPRPWARLIGERAEAGAVSMVIYSYSTPIAWKDAEYGWVIPNVSYSITTSVKHQTHLYRLRGMTYYMPYDATAEDARRVLSGELAFVRDRKGRAVATVPGPNYRPEFPAFRSTVVHEDGSATERWVPGRIILDSERGFINGGI